MTEDAANNKRVEHLNYKRKERLKADLIDQYGINVSYRLDYAINRTLT